MPGPLPDPNHRHRNAPTIPTTNLPASGRKGAAPRPPKGYELGERGRAWWGWAWKLPQACGWSAGDRYVVARRAALEDSVAALQQVDDFDLGEVLGLADEESARRVKAVIGHLRGLATNRIALEREMREIDDRLGLTPKGLAALRWKIVPDVDEQAPTSRKTTGVASIADRRARLTGAS